MKVETLRPIPMPYGRLLPVGTVLDVIDQASYGVQCEHKLGRVFLTNLVEPHDYREITPETRQADFINNRAFLKPALTRTLALLCVFYVIFAVNAQAAPRSIVTERFLNQLAAIESHHNPQAIGDHGKARGEFQLWRCAWDAVNSQPSTLNYQLRASYDQATNSIVARRYARAYLRILEAHLVKSTGKAPAPAELYAAWNLGPVRFRSLSYNLANAPKTTQHNAQRFQ